VTDDDLLAGLDDIPWADLQHAYNSAFDVPDFLRAIQSGTQVGRFPPSVLLADRIVHQGTRYEAARYAVPFLVRMAFDTTIGQRHSIVGLLASIAIGLDNNCLPNGYDPEEDRAYLALMRTESADWPQWIAEAPDEQQRELREKSCAQVMVDAEAALLAYDAVRAELPTLARLLYADDIEIRIATAHLLAWFPESAEASIPALTEFVTSEKSAGAAAAAIVALGLIGDPAAIPFVHQHLGDSATELRWAAVFALTRLGVADDPTIRDISAEPIADQPENPATMVPYLNGRCTYRQLAKLAMECTPRPEK